MNISTLKFNQQVKKHLSHYKLNELNIAEPGEYNYKGKTKYYPHILPLDKKKENILEDFRLQFFDSKYGKIKFHKDFHHLNSSQAMCINFFYPLIQFELLNLLLPILSINASNKISKECACFEKDSLLEKGSTRKTNFDFYFKLETGEHVYFEIKYTENGFGSAKNDESHRDKYEQVYWTILEKNPYIEKEYCNVQQFLKNYQIMRNLIHINSNSYVVFLYPEGNLKVKEQAEHAKNNIIKENWKDHLILITWEYLLNKIRNNKLPKQLEMYYQKFEHKYFPKNY